MPTTKPTRVEQKILEEDGWRVIRFWNNDVLANTEGVVETILRMLQEA